MYFIKKILLVAFIFLAPNLVLGASLYVTSDKTSYNVGDVFYVNLSVSSKESLNAISSTLNIAKIFKIESVSKSNSVLNFWVTEPSFDSVKNQVSLEGVSLTGTLSGNVLNIKLKALSSGSGNITVASSEILANDGSGTNITENPKSLSINVTESKKPVIEDDKKEVVQEVVLPKYYLSKPEISFSSIDGNSVIEGVSAYPRSDVVLTFISDKSSKIFISGITDGNGSFVINVPSVLKVGSYSVSATILDNNGKKTPPSDTLSVMLGGRFCDVTKICDIDAHYFVYSIIAIIILSAFSVSFLLFKYKDTYNLNKLKKEVDDTEDLIHKSFDDLKEDLYMKKNSQLKIEKIKDDLDKAEEDILDRVEDIKKNSKKK